MDEPTCPIDGCTRPVERRGYCKVCYYRLKRHGVIANLPKLPPIRERFMDAVTVTPAGCWEWQGARNNYGYGHLNVGPGKSMYAHRFSYEKHVGPIPEGMELDHLCRNPPCCNPAHLEPVTHRENLGRSAPVVACDGHCERGHLMSGDNVYVYPDGKRRECRACSRRRDQGRPSGWSRSRAAIRDLDAG